MDMYELIRALSAAQVESALPPEIEYGLWTNLVTLHECGEARINPPQSYLAYVERMLAAANVATVVSESEAAQ